MSDPDSASPFHEVWVVLGHLRERLQLTGYDVTAEGVQLLRAMATLGAAWNDNRQKTKDVKFYDDLYLMVREFGTNYGSRDAALRQLVASSLKALVGAKKELIGSSITGQLKSKT